MRFRSPRTRAYDQLPQILAIKKALRPVTTAEVRGMLAIGLKSEEELHPDFPATGERLSGDRKVGDQAYKADGSDVSELSEGDSRRNALPAQPPLLNIGHVFREVEQRLLG